METTRLKHAMRWLCALSIACAPFSQTTANSFDSFKQQHQQGYARYAQTLDAEFQQFQQVYREELKRYALAIGKHWPDLQITDRTQWVEYSRDWQTRRIVDYANNEIRLQFKSDQPKPDLTQETLRELQTLLSKPLQQAYRDDPVLTRTLRRLRQPAPQLGASGRQPVLSELEQTTPEQLLRKAITRTRTLGDPNRKRATKSLTTVVVPLPKSRPHDKAKQFQPWVDRYAEETGLDPALVLAIIHTESHFNPMARSHVPAYGLMQIVPTTAGRDVAKVLYGQERLLSPNFLYQPANNIKVGATYLSLLYNRYLNAIDNPQSRLYCAIAAYNTGAGNVARAFNSGTSIRKAAERINRMTPQQVYNHLYRRLPYKETRDYLRQVTSRQRLYVNL